MKKLIKKTLAVLGLYHPSLGIKVSQERKAQLILKHKRPDTSVFVETGTNTGWMIERLSKEFDEIVSIELDKALHDMAREKFGRVGIKLILGDSATMLGRALEEISKPAVFWLDAHGSGEITSDNSPIIAELQAVFSHPIKDHVIIIDDARHFDIKTIKMIERLARENEYKFRIEEGLMTLLK